MESMDRDFLQQGKLVPWASARVAREGVVGGIVIFLHPLGKGLHQLLLTAVPVNLEYMQGTGSSRLQI